MKIERDLQSVVPRADWARFPHLLIWHGRRVCDARARSASTAFSSICAPQRGSTPCRREGLGPDPALDDEVVASVLLGEERVARR